MKSVADDKYALVPRRLMAWIRPEVRAMQCGDARQTELDQTSVHSTDADIFINSRQMPIETNVSI